MLFIYPAGVSNGYIKFEKNIKNFEIPEKIYLHSAIVPTAIVNACTISSRLILEHWKRRQQPDLEDRERG